MCFSGRRFRLVLLVGATLSAAAAGRAWAGESVERSCQGLERGPEHTVARVLDGETVILDDGRELRLIGALAPRAEDAGADPGAWPAEVAAIAELRSLVLGKSVALAFGGERSDRYGRLQAHAYVQDGGSQRWVQGYLLQQGLARAYVAAGNRACAEALLAAESKARSAGRGLWADAAYHARRADHPLDLARRRSTFQLVEGRVAAVAQVRGMIYLNFDADWRRAFTVAVKREDRALLGADVGSPKHLAGRIVRVRGWIERRTGAATGPVIELSTAGLMEVLDESAPDATSVPGGADRRGDMQSPTQESKPPSLVETGR